MNLQSCNHMRVVILAAALLGTFACNSGPKVPATSSGAAEMVQAHLAALNSKDPARIHDFVSTYCTPAMLPVEKTMLRIGTTSSPFTFQKIDSTADGRVVAEVTNGRGVHEYLTAKLDSSGKVTGLLLGPPPLANEQAQKMAEAYIQALNAKDPASVHAFVTANCTPEMEQVEEAMLRYDAPRAPFTFDKIDSNATGQIVAEVVDGKHVHEFLTLRIGSSGKIAGLWLGVPTVSQALAEEIVRAHLTALNSKDPERIHAFVTTYCDPSMAPVEKSMLHIGTDSSPFVMKKISSNAAGRIVANVVNAQMEPEYLTIHVDSRGKITGIYLSPI